MHDESPTSRDRRALRRTLIAFAATAAIAVGAFAGASAFTHDDGSGTPAHTVRDFLIDAVADRDGFDACDYLTRRSVQQVLATEPRGMSCEAAVASYARLTLAGERIDTEAAVKALTYRAVRQSDGSERVTVSWHGESRSFVLQRATHRELVEFGAPPTPWRIDSGLVELVRR
jgi:hypothetical protein